MTMPDHAPTPDPIPVAAPTAPTAPWSRWAERAALRCTGVALALTAAGVGAADGAADRFGPAAVVAATAFALWAAPPLEEPPHRPHRWPGRLAGSRSTVLAAGSVLLAALGEPPFGRIAAVAALLIGYLLLVDVLGPQRDGARPAHVLAALAASGLVLSVAFAPTGAGEWSRPIALAGLAATGWGVARALRPRPGG
ncbi:hypothetical protein [Kitasatospora purpeofusca]|uniref:hypothetical protein n=1 Tax=Kitasatospora purpeofusca TaxID=67352 RepID=UPI002A59AEF3|nr:hypothetical protein [Kitasatospora purpeofusca]MDY0816513.1 hypothetical protein [Kitasatospora purpeofusca]